MKELNDSKLKERSSLRYYLSQIKKPKQDEQDPAYKIWNFDDVKPKKEKSQPRRRGDLAD